MPKRPEELGEQIDDHPLVPQEEKTQKDIPLEPVKPENLVEKTETNTIEPKSSEDPFEPPKPGLYITKGFLAGKPVRILIDDGSVLNHVSEQFCKELRIPTKEENYEALMANKTTEKLRSTCYKIPLSIESYTESMRFAVGILTYDVILGKKWLNEHHGTTDCRTNEVKFRHKDKKYRIIANDNTLRNFSVNSIVNVNPVETPIYAIVLKPTSEEKPKKYPKDLEKVLNEFKDVFPKKLPKGPPPRRFKDFSIDLVPGAKPEKRRIYRMSDLELEEVQKKLQELLDQEFIRPSASPWGAPVLFVTKKGWRSAVLR